MPTEVIGEDGDGELAIAWPDGDGDVDQMFEAIISASTPQSGDGGRDRYGGDVGPVPRFSDQSGVWGSVDLQSFSFNSTELATTIKRFRNEMYRNQFPVIHPRFTHRCVECGIEYDEERDVCDADGCDSTEFETPSRAQKHWFDTFLQSVNDDGQSARSLLKFEEDYQSFYGVSTILARLRYQQVTRESRVGDRSLHSVTRWEPAEIKELVHADPLRIKPVLDENNRHGGWWTCPKHRDEYWEGDALTFEEGADHPNEVCPECHGQLEEVGYAETSGRSDDVDRIYLKHEVIDWARHFPIRGGLDGRSPAAPLVKLQAILQWSRNYELQYLNPQNDKQLPDKFIVAYGNNIKQNLRASMQEEEAKNPWEEGRLMYNGDPDDVEIDILDLSTSGGINGREPMVDRLMSQIRAMFGVTDAFENELSDTGGLNAEGTQVEITNSAVATAHQDTKDQALNKLCRLVEMVQGHCDWELSYVDPESEDAALSSLEVLQGIQKAQETGTKVVVEDGQLQIPDQEFDPVEEPRPDANSPEAADTGEAGADTPPPSDAGDEGDTADNAVDDGEPQPPEDE